MAKKYHFIQKKWKKCNYLKTASGLEVLIALLNVICICGEESEVSVWLTRTKPEIMGGWQIRKVAFFRCVHSYLPIMAPAMNRMGQILPHSFSYNTYPFNK